MHFYYIRALYLLEGQPPGHLCTFPSPQPPCAPAAKGVLGLGGRNGLVEDVEAPLALRPPRSGTRSTVNWFGAARRVGRRSRRGRFGGTRCGTHRDGRYAMHGFEG